MPKSGKNEKLHKSKPYSRVTPKSLNRFSYFHPEDGTNLTSTDRNEQDYADNLGLDSSLKDLIIKLAKTA